MDSKNFTPPSAFRRHAPKVVVSLVLGGGFAWALGRGGLPIVPDRAAFAHVTWWAMPAYVVVLACVLMLRAYRWTHLLRPIADVPARRVIGVGLVGMAAILYAPLRMGELVRPWMLAERTPITFAQAAGTVAAERIIDGMLLSLVLLAGLLLSTPLSPLPPHVVLVRLSAWAALGVFTSAFVAMGAFYALRDLARKVTLAIIGVVSKRVAAAVTTQVERLADGLRFLPSAGHTLPYLRDTVVYWLSNAFAMWLLLRGCGVEATIPEACVTMGVLGVGILLPAGPGFFGAFQASVYAALAMFFSSEVVTGPGAAYVFLLYVGQVGVSLVALVVGLRLSGDAIAPKLATETLLRHTGRHAPLAPSSSLRGRRARCRGGWARRDERVRQDVVRFALLARADVQRGAATRARRHGLQGHREGPDGRVRAVRVQEQRVGRPRVDRVGRDGALGRQGEGRRAAHADAAVPRASPLGPPREEAARRVRRAGEEAAAAASAARWRHRRRAVTTGATG
jgi:hypothetical protein